MKLNYDISWILIRIPILPWLKITKIEPQVRIVRVPTPTPTEETAPTETQEISEYSRDKVEVKGYSRAKRTKSTGGIRGDHPQDPTISHYRLTGSMAGTERYRSDHARKDLIRFMTENNNEALTRDQIRKHPNSPFKHNYVKCTPECTHKIISRGVLHHVLSNEANKYDNLLERYGTTDIFIMTRVEDEAPFVKTSKSQYNRHPILNAYQLNESVYFNELNILTRNDFVTRTLAKEVTVTTETKKPEYGYQREAIDRMT